MERKEHIFSRHAKKITNETPENEISEKYFGITKEGEIETRERAKELVAIINRSQKGSVFVLGGVSKAGRTRSTLEVYADELKKIFDKKDNVIFPFKGGEESEGLHEKLRKLRELSENRAQKEEKRKMVIEFPLWIKQFAASRSEWEEWENYFAGVKNEVGEKNETAQWLNVRKGPSPENIAKNFLKGIRREEDFFKKFFPDSPITFINVDHSAELIALFIYLANKGMVNNEGFEKIGGTDVKESEISRLIFSPSGEIRFEYRGSRFFCPPEIFENDKNS